VKLNFAVLVTGLLFVVENCERE